MRTGAITATVSGDPRAEMFRLFDSPAGPRLLIVPHSRIFAVDRAFANALRAGDRQAAMEAAALAASVDGEVPLDSVPDTTVQSISLNVSSTCNLACGYCYAGRGGFDGAQSSAMSWEVARGAIDLLLNSGNPAAPITLGFIGGEPFLSRKLIRQAVEYCWENGRQRGLAVRFAVTTNGTVISREDLELLRAYPFAVTISIDGGAATQDAQRPPAAGHSSFASLRDCIGPLLERPGLAKVAARATVIRTNLEIGDRLDEIIALGFREAGFSPVRMGRSEYPLRDGDWRLYLDSMITVARRQLKAAISGEPIRLTNFAIALKQLHRGFSMPYPCGAGGGYFSVATDGTWYACHRAVGQDSYALGGNDGIDEIRRASFLRSRHVHAQSECRVCWARYLCSGGCHQEASARSDSSCGFIRGWLDFCLSAYSELMERRPIWFTEQS